MVAILSAAVEQCAEDGVPTLSVWRYLANRWPTSEGASWHSGLGSLGGAG
jgi:hypothetical protein